VVTPQAPVIGPGNILSGPGENAIYNLGLIQTAFKGTGKETATFTLTDFFNGGAPPSSKVSEGSGLLSMIDGGRRRCDQD
jgi:hypothetical protein